MTDTAVPRLRAEAPSRFAFGVLERLGLGDEYVAEEGPTGLLFAAWNQRGVSFVSATGDTEEFAERFAARFDRPLRPGSRPPAGLVQALRTLRTPPSLRFDLDHLRPFAQAVLASARCIPPGEVRSYSWVAREAGNPAAVRAAGTALGRNPVPLLVPCHRVVRTDGRIGDYALGPEMKRAVLIAEGVDLAELEARGRRGRLCRPS